MGTKRVLLVSTFLSGLLSLASVWTSLWNVWALVAVRVAMGLVQGVLFPSINPMLIRWAARGEQAKFSAVASMGGTFGTIFIYPVVGLIIKYYDWESAFVLGGIVSLLWCLFWFFLVTDDPTEHKLISKSELGYIMVRKCELKRYQAPTYQ